jgi:hypothetical protein
MTSAPIDAPRRKEKQNPGRALVPSNPCWWSLHERSRSGGLHLVRIRELWYSGTVEQGDGEDGTKRLARIRGYGMRSRISKANGEAGQDPIARTGVSASGHGWGLVRSARPKRRGWANAAVPLHKCTRRGPCGEGVKWHLVLCLLRVCLPKSTVCMTPLRL